MTAPHPSATSPHPRTRPLLAAAKYVACGPACVLAWLVISVAAAAPEPPEPTASKTSQNTSGKSTANGSNTSTGPSTEANTRIHRLTSTKRSTFDAFAYVNRIPIVPEDDETQDDLAGRILGRLANQEGRVLVKLPPGMSRQAYDGFKQALEFSDSLQSAYCTTCHHLPDFADPTAATPAPSLRNRSYTDDQFQRFIQSESHKKLVLTNAQTNAVHAFIKTLTDVPDADFRPLIVNAQVTDVTTAISNAGDPE